MGLTSKPDQGMISLPVDAMVLQELSVLASLGCPSSSYPGLLSVVAAGQLRPKRMVSRTVGLDEVTSVYADMTEFNTHGFTTVTGLDP